MKSPERNPLKDAVKEFNKLHGSEATAELVDVKHGSIAVEFWGQFCMSCGVRDYFDDLTIELEKRLNRPVEIAKIEERGDRFLVIFKIAGL